MTQTFSGGGVVTLAPNVHLRALDDGRWFAATPDVPGAWGAGPSQQEALDELCDVIRAQGATE